MIAIIPARSGSKGLPGKNIKPLCGKPMIAYTIEAALNSKYIEKVIVSTDDQKIAKIAEEYGAWVPFLRPKELAQDNSKAKDTYLYVIEKLEKEYGIKKDKFMVLLPTAPLRTSLHIDEAYEKFFNSSATTLISCKKTPYPPSWLLIERNGKIKPFQNIKQALNNRQDNDEFYIPNGAIYILDYYLLKEKETYYCDNTVSYLMTEESSIDIDYEFDFRIASLLLENEKNSNK